MDCTAVPGRRSYWTLVSYDTPPFQSCVFISKHQRQRMRRLVDILHHCGQILVVNLACHHPITLLASTRVNQVDANMRCGSKIDQADFPASLSALRIFDTDTVKASQHEFQVLASSYRICKEHAGIFHGTTPWIFKER